MAPRATGNVRLPDVLVDADTADRVKLAATGRGESISDTIRRGLGYVAYEPPVYSFAPGGHSLVKDLAARRDGMGGDPDGEARDRLARFERWSCDVAERFQQGTGDLGDVLPPGYRLVTELAATAERPLVAAADRGTIADATVFAVPTIAEPIEDVIDAARAEGTNPSPGDFTPEIARGVVQPISVQGVVELTREIVDAASPAGDLVALSVAAESYRRQVEARIYAELNAAQAGTLSNGFSPDGAMVVESAATVTDDLKAGLGRFASTRLRRPRNVVVGSTHLGDVDAWQSTSVASWERVELNAATTPFGAGATDADAVVLGSGDLWSWESPLLRFTYSERNGPAGVDVALAAYHATRLVRPRGLLAVRIA